MVLVITRPHSTVLVKWIPTVVLFHVIMWKFGGIECTPFPESSRIIQPDQNGLRGMLKDKLDHPDDHNFLRVESKVGKRDLWEFVSGSRDVVPIEMDSEKNFTTSSSRLYESSSSDSRKVLSNTISSHQDVQMRLNKLEYYFSGLRIFDEDCRQRLICEVSMDPPKFAPLSGAFLDETSYNGDEKILSARLLTSNEGTRLLTYIEASQRGLNREGCDVWAYRCPQTTETLINFQSLLTWREVLKWLTVKMVAKRQ